MAGFIDAWKELPKVSGDYITLGTDGKERISFFDIRYPSAPWAGYTTEFYIVKYWRASK